MMKKKLGNFYEVSLCRYSELRKIRVGLAYRQCCNLTRCPVRSAENFGPNGSWTKLRFVYRRFPFTVDVTLPLTKSEFLFAIEMKNDFLTTCNELL